MYLAIARCGANEKTPDPRFSELVAAKRRRKRWQSQPAPPGRHACAPRRGSAPRRENKGACPPWGAAALGRRLRRAPMGHTQPPLPQAPRQFMGARRFPQRLSSGRYTQRRREAPPPPPARRTSPSRTSGGVEVFSVSISPRKTGPLRGGTAQGGVAGIPTHRGDS